MEPKKLLWYSFLGVPIKYVEIKIWNPKHLEINPSTSCYVGNLHYHTEATIYVWL